jgi:hypothetical protein
MRLIAFAAAAWLAALGTASPPGVSAQSGGGQRIVAVGDVHGDADNLAAILRAAGLIDAAGRWSGGSTRLVQTGDFTDRGADVREAMELLMRLENQAGRAGGRVDVLFGNHEAFNVLRELRDVSPEAYARFADRRSEDRRRRAYETHASIVGSGNLPRGPWMASHPAGVAEYLEAMDRRGRYGRWIRSKKAMLQIGDTIFMHAGLNPERPVSVEDVNREVERDVSSWDALVEALQQNRLIGPAFTLQDIIDAAQREIGRIGEAQKTGTPLPEHVTREFVAHLRRFPEIIAGPLVNPDGPLWYRGLATLPAAAVPQIEAMLTRLGARRIVIGHTPQLPGGRIAARFGARVLAIDTGMLATHYTGGRPSALEILDGRLTAIYTDGRQPLGTTETAARGLIARPVAAGRSR